MTNSNVKLHSIQFATILPTSQQAMRSARCWQ